MTHSNNGKEQPLTSGESGLTHPCAAEQRYAALFEMAHDAVFIIDRAGTILEVNDTGCEMLRCGRASLVGHAISDYLPDRATADFADRMEGVEAGGRWSARTLGRRHDGSAFIMDASCWIMPDDTFAAICRDVTAGEQAIADLEELVREAHCRERRAAAIESATRAVLENPNFEDAARSVLEACAAMGAGRGYVLIANQTTQELSPVCWIGTKHPLPGNGQVPPQALIEDILSQDGGIYVNCPDSRHAFAPSLFSGPIVNFLLSPISLDDHIKGAICLADRRGGFNEEDLHIVDAFAAVLAVGLRNSFADEAIRQSERKFRLTFEGSRDAVFWADPESGILLHCNTAAELLLGRPRADLIGLNQTCLHPPENESHGREMFRQHVEAGGHKPLLNEIVHADGRRIPVEISASVIDLGGQAVIQGVFRDVSYVRMLSARYMGLFEHMLNGFALHELITDDNGSPVDYRYLAVNPAFERLTGIDSKDLIGKTVREVMPETERHWIEAYGKVALTGEPLRYEEYSAALGRYFEVEAYCPQLGQFACVCMDVTERRTAENLRHANEIRMELAQTAARAGTWEYDLRTGLTICSESLWRLIDITPREAQAGLHTWFLSMNPDDKSTVMALWEMAVEKKADYEAEWRVVTSDGSPRWLMARGRPVFDDDGEIASYVGITIDATKDMRDRERLNEINFHLDTANRVARIGMWKWFREARAIIWSPELFAFVGRSHADGNPSWEEMARYYTSESLEILHKSVREVQHSGKDFDIELEMITERGSTLWTRVIGSALRGISGEIVGLQGAAHDIDRRKRAEIELLEHRARLQGLTAELLASRETERRRIAVDLHDGIGQALAAAKMTANMLRADSAPDVAKDVDQVIGLVDYAISGVRSLTMELSPPALYELGLGAALEWLTSTYEERYGLKCRLDVDAPLVTKKTDGAVMLFRIARELLNNAHRHSGTDEAKASVWLMDDMIALRVIDGGRGFDVSSALRAHADNGRFGLFSVREQVLAAGGTIEFDSRPGGGATIDVRVPLGQDCIGAASRLG